MTRPPAKAEDIRRLMQALGRGSRGPGRVFLTGGAFEAIARIKDDLRVNVELASPDQFIPDPPGSLERAEFIAREGSVDFFHYDYYAQALAKIERGHARDRLDVKAMVRTGLIDVVQLRTLFEAIEPLLLRFPAIDPAAFRAKVEAFLSEPG
jgi:hypothetical protein